LESDDEIVGGVALSTTTMVLGHSTYGQISIWRWDTDKYLMLKKTKLIHGMNENNIHLTHFQLSQSCTNEIFLSSQYSNIYRVPILLSEDFYDIDPDKKTLLHYLKMQKLVDMR
jgi:hypothetical protein